jgi:hypothetical protein
MSNPDQTALESVRHLEQVRLQAIRTNDADAMALILDDKFIPGLESWLKLNAKYASAWPNIMIKRAPPNDAKAFDGMPNKLEKYFTPDPGQGD